MRNQKSVSILLVILLFSPCFLVFPARASGVFSDGFESGDFSAWTGTTVTSGYGSLNISTNQMHSGSYSEKAQVSSQNTWTDAYVYKAVPGFPTLYSRFYVYLESFSTQYFVEGFGEYSGAGMVAVSFGLRGDLSLWLLYRNGTTYSTAISSTKLPLHSWVCLEMKATVDNSLGEVRVWMNGNEISDLTQTNLNNSDAQSILGIKYGIYSAYATNATLYIDDVVAAESYVEPMFQPTFAQSGLDNTSSGTVVTVNGSQKSYVDLPFSVLANRNSQMEYVYEEMVASNVSGKRFDLVNVTGPSSPFTVTSNITLTGNYKTQYYLTVNSPYGSPSPSSGWYDANTQIIASVTSPFLGSNGTKYTCAGWTGTGSVPTSGTASNVTFTITQPSTITWYWNNHYLLNVSTDPPGLIPQPTRNPQGQTGPSNSWWYDAYTKVNLTALQIKGYDFTNWYVDGVTQGNGNKAITVTMDKHHVATAHYTLDNTPPQITILSPKNQIYYSNSIPLNFTITKTASWIGYRMDSQTNATITGNKTITVGEGAHSIIVYANDTAGNMGSSNVVHFEARTKISDVAVALIRTSKTVIGQGYSITINVTVENLGDYAETSNLTIYANATALSSETITLASHVSSIVTATWNTTGFIYGNYKVSAFIKPVPGETNVTDNMLVGGTITVTILGDVNGDGRINVLDLIQVAIHLGHTSGDGHAPFTTTWYACVNSDLNNDGRHDVLDLIICALHIGQHWS